MSALAAGEVHLWLDLLEGVPEESPGEFLDPGERDYLEGLRHPGRREEFLRGRLLIRRSLAQYVQEPAQGWRFCLQGNGRPELATGVAAGRLRFNLSHTRGCMVCLVNLDRDAGVDVEWTARPGRTVELAGRFFAPWEVRQLQDLPGEAQREQFFRYWTLKEAYMKATGLGMALPLDQFGFDVVGEEVRGIAFGARIEDDPGVWSFQTVCLGPDHRAGVAVRRLPGEDKAPRFRWFRLPEAVEEDLGARPGSDRLGEPGS